MVRPSSKRAVLSDITNTAINNTKNSEATLMTRKGAIQTNTNEASTAGLVQEAVDIAVPTDDPSLASPFVDNTDPSLPNKTRASGEVVILDQEHDPTSQVSTCNDQALVDACSRITAFSPMSAEEASSTYWDQPELIRERFLDGGIYEHLYNMLLDSKVSDEKRPKMLATAELKKDFTVERPTKSSIVCARKDGSIALFTCFGEIATALEGTRLSAKGNHFATGSGTNFTFVRDDTPVKNILMLRTPQAAPPAITQLFIEQVCLLEEIITSIEAQEDEVWENIPWVRCARNNDGVPNAIAISTPRIYTVPAGSGTFYEPKNTRRMGGPSDAASLIHPTGDAIHPKAVYDPRLLPDFGGSYFQLRKAKLSQQNFYDINDRLIPPWEVYDKLRPGTLVAVTVSLECYVRPEEKKKFYQARMHKLSIIAESATRGSRNLSARP